MQRLKGDKLPSGLIALADGRVAAGTASAASGAGAPASADDKRGRNPIYLGFSSGAVMRLHPVPVDRQLQDMIAQYQVI